MAKEIKEINNPVQELATGVIRTVLKDVFENDQMGTASKRTMDVITKATIKQTWIFNDLSAQLKHANPGIHKLINSVRQGWSERNVYKDYDFDGIQTMNALTENIIIDKYLESKIKWNIEDYADTEAMLDRIVPIVQSAILEELPIEFEKRILQMLVDGFKLGVEWRNDQGIVATAKLPVVNVSYDTPENTKKMIKEFALNSFEIRRLDNPMFYQPGMEGYTLVITPETDWALQEIGAYEVNGALGTYENFLGNKPTKVLAGNLKVMITPALPEDIAGLTLNERTYYTALPRKMNTRAGFMAVSATEMFMTIETGAFGMQMGYWNARFSKIKMFINTEAIASGLTAYFEGFENQDGNGNVHYKLTGESMTDGSKIFVQVFDQYGEKVGDANSPGSIDNGSADHNFALTDQKSGTYVIEITYNEDENTSKLLYRSANYQIRNKSDKRETASEIVNRAVKNKTDLTTTELKQVLIEKANDRDKDILQPIKKVVEAVKETIAKKDTAKETIKVEAETIKKEAIVEAKETKIETK